jgi:hypothetical protein
MLRSNLVTSNVLYHLLRNITQRNHAHGLPHTQTDTRHDTAVEALDARLAVDVAESVADGHLFGPVGVVFLALHFHTHDFDGLVPGGETTTEGGCEDLFRHAEFDRGVFLVGDFADAGFAVERVVLVKGSLDCSNSRDTYATRLRPNLEPQLVTCLTATALTPLLMPARPSRR